MAEEMKKQEIEKEKSVETPKEKVQEESKPEKQDSEKTGTESEEKTPEKPQIEKPEKKPEKPKKKKSYAVVNSYSLPISTKQSVAISRFIKNKKIEDALNDIQKVAAGKRAVPMKGEIPHRKGKMMSGRFPIKAAGHFVKLLKSLSANANLNDLNNPVISESISNIAQRPYGKHGRVRKKRTHVKLIAREARKKGELSDKKSGDVA